MSLMFAILLAVLSVGLLIAIGALYIQKRQLELQVVQLTAEITSLKSKNARIVAETEKGITDAQQLIDQQVAELKTEGMRIQQYYEGEARKATETIRAQLDKAVQDMARFKKYEELYNAEESVRAALVEAMADAVAMKEKAQDFMNAVQVAAEREQILAVEKAREIYEQADARLNQATTDAERIVAEAENQAHQIAGDAYESIRDKRLLEKAAEAIRNMIDGYGDRYLIPTHSLLDDLATEFGYTAAGEALKSSRLQTRRMVEQGIAASCDYAEASRRNTAIRFMIDAFNGRVDAILSRVKRDNFGTLQQEIRDAYSLVNLNGDAFRNARIRPAYLDSRLNELKWAVVVQELARQRMEEQRDLKARMRDEEKARKEREAQMRQVEKEEEIKKKAVEEKERELMVARTALEKATAEEKAKMEMQIAQMIIENANLQKDLAAATEKRLTIAQQTKRGHVYIISNIGSFGENIFKIGQTRRLVPQERIDELGDASVPFAFDVHAWIESDNAPALEHKLQKCFLANQLNKINSRKEFFKVSLKELRDVVEKLKQGDEFTIKHWTDVAEATQYRATLDIESNSEKLAKWLERANTVAERSIRLDTLRLSNADIASLEDEENVD